MKLCRWCSDVSCVCVAKASEMALPTLPMPSQYHPGSQQNNIANNCVSFLFRFVRGWAFSQSQIEVNIISPAIFLTVCRSESAFLTFCISEALPCWLPPLILCCPVFLLLFSSLNCCFVLNVGFRSCASACPMSCADRI